MTDREKNLKTDGANVKIKVEDLTDSEVENRERLLPKTETPDTTPVFEPVPEPESPESDPRNPENRGP